MVNNYCYIVLTYHHTEKEVHESARFYAVYKLIEDTMYEMNML